MTLGTRLTSLAFVALAAFAGWTYIGKTRVEAQFATYKAEVKQAIADAQAQARATEQRYAQSKEQLENELAEKNRLLVARAAAARRADAGLRDEIARLNARPAPSDSIAAAAAVEARAARELLGACSQRYTDMAGEADELRDQVSGLLTFVRSIIKPPL